VALEKGDGTVIRCEFTAHGEDVTVRFTDDAGVVGSAIAIAEGETVTGPGSEIMGKGSLGMTATFATSGLRSSYLEVDVQSVPADVDFVSQVPAWLSADLDDVFASDGDGGVKVRDGAGFAILDEAETVTGQWRFPTLDVDRLRVKSGPHIDATHRDFGAVGDGVTDDTAAIQSALDAAAAAGGGVVLLPAGTYSVTSLTVLDKTTLRGVGFTYGASSGGTQVVGSDPSLNVVELGQVGGYRSGIRICDMRISGGLNNIANIEAASHVELERLELSGAANAAIYVTGWAEEWYVSHVQAYGPTGGYAWQAVNVGDSVGGLNYIDKSTIRDCIFAGGTNAVRWELTVINSVVFQNCVFNSTTSHGFHMGGGARALSFIGCSTEGVGQGGKNDRTTGTITSGTNSLTVASAAGYQVGDQITVGGAGSLGQDLYAAVDAIAGTTFTLDTNASTTVNSQPVTNATSDCWHFSSSPFAPAEVSFVGCFLFGEGNNGNQRYSVNANSGTNFLFFGCHVSSSIPIYDPLSKHSYMGGDASAVRQQVSIAGNNHTGHVFNGAKRNIIGSAPGGDLLLYLRDSNDAATGTLGRLEVRKNDPNRTRLFRVDTSDNSVRQDRSDGSLVVEGALDHNGGTLGFFGVTPAAQSSPYTASNVITDRSFDANAMTLDELADVLGTLIADLQALGLLG